jgi:RNA polymerase sigma-70 factor (ECF subfamily)
LTDAGATGTSDAELLRQHVAGDADAFGRLFARHQDRLWAVALRTTGNREDAADALQDAAIKAFRAAGDFRGNAAVTTWLHRIVVNAALDRLRRQSRERPAAEDALELSQGGDGSAVVGHAHPDRPAGQDPGDSVAEHTDLLEALRRVPEEQRVVLVLLDMYAYPVAEVAAILDVPDGTIKSRAARGRRRLAGELGGSPGTPSTGQGNRQGRSDVPKTGASIPQTSDPATKGGPADA